MCFWENVLQTAVLHSVCQGPQWATQASFYMVICPYIWPNLWALLTRRWERPPMPPPGPCVRVLFAHKTSLSRWPAAQCQWGMSKCAREKRTRCSQNCISPPHLSIFFKTLPWTETGQSHSVGGWELCFFCLFFFSVKLRLTPTCQGNDPWTQRPSNQWGNCMALGRKEKLFT